MLWYFVTKRLLEFERFPLLNKICHKMNPTSTLEYYNNAWKSTSLPLIMLKMTSTHKFSHLYREHRCMRPFKRPSTKIGGATTNNTAWHSHALSQKKGKKSLPQHFGHDCLQCMWCDQAKSVWSRPNSVFILLTNCMHHFHSYILQKTPLKLINWFQRYEQLKGVKNNRKQKTFYALFGSILKSIFLTFDWFCLITSHIWVSLHVVSPG